MILDKTESGEYAFCHELDRFVKKKGTALAVKRVLNNLLAGHENKKFRTEIWNKLWNKKPNENSTNLQDS